ncbi:hypothetical protein IQ235_15365 [Oscillatoriales cyanobacterium LEGE 11467]|uniref:Uncharacterized protein n=1 Tax=Zarconia navalis LEGE 11467 TaxID=1828826 RepID=A0A928Z9Y1_9CYAN|nr:hypothetical protein [Zarconia navalis]MBE9042158.1 hypothetical protein [Zarconia navalis LEGE 11467]
MGQLKVTYLDVAAQDPQEIDADGHYLTNNQFEFYKDSVAGEQQVHALDGSDIERVENLAEQAKATDSGRYQIIYYDDRETEDVPADGYHENGDWLEFYCDSVVGEKVVLSLKKSLVRQVERM